VNRPARTVRVLIVDDQSVFRAVMRTAVEDTHGFEVVGEAESGESALELVPAVQPDFVVMDVRMPGLDGLETARLLAERHPGIAVLLLSVTPFPAAEAAPAPVLDKAELGPRMLADAWGLLTSLRPE
jgi:CheY-like chemotaxis protein